MRDDTSSIDDRIESPVNPRLSGSSLIQFIALDPFDAPAVDSRRRSNENFFSIKTDCHIQHTGRAPPLFPIMSSTWSGSTRLQLQSAFIRYRRNRVEILVYSQQSFSDLIASVAPWQEILIQHNRLRHTSWTRPSLLCIYIHMWVDGLSYKRVTHPSRQSELVYRDVYTTTITSVLRRREWVGK